MYSNARKVLVAATALATVTWFAAPAAAQRGRGGDQGRGSSQRQGGGNPRGGGDRRAAQPRQDAPRPQEKQARPEAQRSQPSQQAQRFGGGAQGRQVAPQPQTTQRFGGGAQTRQAAPQPQTTQRFGGGAQTRQVAPPVQGPGSAPRYAVPRQQVPSAPAQSNRNAAPAYRNAAPAYRNTAPAYRNTAPAYRGGAAPGNYNYRPSQGYHTQRYYSQPNYVVRPYVVRRPVFVQPYYAFRPRLSLSFGIRVGYGVSYPFSSWDPFAFYNYHLGIQPGYNYRTYYDRVGGLNFEIDPYDAEVYIDGEFVGYASDFSPEQMPLTLIAGRHRVELAAPGYEEVSFDITVVAGQVIPYQGTLPYGR